MEDKLSGPSAGGYNVPIPRSKSLKEEEWGRRVTDKQRATEGRVVWLQDGPEMTWWLAMQLNYRVQTLTPDKPGTVTRAGNPSTGRYRQN